MNLATFYVTRWQFSRALPFILPKFWFFFRLAYDFPFWINFNMCLLPCWTRISWDMEFDICKAVQVRKSVRRVVSRERSLHSHEALVQFPCPMFIFTTCLLDDQYQRDSVEIKPASSPACILFHNALNSSELPLAKISRLLITCLNFITFPRKRNEQAEIKLCQTMVLTSKIFIIKTSFDSSALIIRASVICTAMCSAECWRFTRK